MKASAKNAVTESAPAPVESTAVIEDSGIGEVKIHENVIASLARRAALEVEGVSRLAGSQLVDNIAEIVGSRRMQDRAINVILNEDNQVSLEIKLNIIVGYRMPKVAAEVQQAVVSSIETATGMNVAKVDVLVQEVDSPVEEDEGEGGAAADVPTIIPPPTFH